MRTTIDLDDHIYSLTKQAAEKQKMPMRLMIEDALRYYLTRQSLHEVREDAPEWPTIPYARMAPGMETKTSSELLDIE